jgi:hypothetical protein
MKGNWGRGLAVYRFSDLFWNNDIYESWFEKAFY